MSFSTLSTLNKTEAGEQLKYNYKVKNKQSLYSGHIKLDRYDVSFDAFQGGEIDAIRECTQKNDVVGVLAYDPEAKKYLFVEQFRIGLIPREQTPWALEIVAGYVEEGDDIDSTALRELSEETGTKGRNLQHLLSYHPSLGASAGCVHLFYCEVSCDDIIEFGGLAEETEDIRVHTYDENSLKEMIKDGRISNAMTILALQHLWLYGKTSHGVRHV